MSSGRKPTPTALKLVKGNPGRRPLNEKEAKVDLSRPAPPSFLSQDAVMEWGRVIDTLYNAGLMSDLDRAVLAAYCQAYGRWAQAERALARMAEKDPLNSGLMIKTSNGNAIQNPLVGAANKAAADMVRYAVEFGMSPSARAKVNASQHGEEDAIEKFFG